MNHVKRDRDNYFTKHRYILETLEKKHLLSLFLVNALLFALALAIAFAGPKALHRLSTNDFGHIKLSDESQHCIVFEKNSKEGMLIPRCTVIGYVFHSK